MSEEINKVERDIYLALRKNRLIVWGCVAAVVIIVIVAFVFNHKTQQYYMNHVQTMDVDGDVIPLKWQEKKDVKWLAIQNNVALILKRRFDYDFNDVDSPKRQDQMLRLFDRTEGKNIINSEGDWYKKVRRKNLIQKIEVIPESVKASVKDMSFQGSAVLTITDGRSKTRYQITSTGNLKEVKPSFPDNPHGLVAFNYRESRKKLKEEK